MTLNQIGRQTSSEVIFTSEDVQGRRAPAVRGNYTPEEALQVALRGTSLNVRRTPQGAYLIQQAPDTGEGNVGSAATSSESADSADIIVTARRTQERLQDVPISITVFNQEQLSNRNVTSSVELASYTPSLAVNSRFGPDKASFAIRGFSQDLNTLPTVGVYFADVVSPRLVSNTTSGNGAGVGSLFDLQNIQVLKGPQGTLFGRNTTGGAILIVPQRPTDRLEGYVEGTIGNYDAHRVQSVINLPLSDTFRVRIGIDRNKRDGYVKSRSGIGPRDFNDIDYFAARLSILGQLTENLENYVIATYSKYDTHGPLAKVAICNRTGAGTGIDGNIALSGIRLANCAKLDAQASYGYHEAENSNPDPYVRGRIWQIIDTTTWQANDRLTIKNIVSYGEAQESYSVNVTGDNIATPFVTTYPGIGKPQGSQYSFTEELQFQGRSANDRFVWQAGFYMERSNPLGGQEQWTSIFSRCSDIYNYVCGVNRVGTVVAGSSISVARNNYFFRNHAGYAQATYKFSPQLSLTGGIRYTHDRAMTTGDGFSAVPSPTGRVGNFTCSQKRDANNARLSGPNFDTDGTCFRRFVQESSRPTWLAGLDFRPTEDVLLYAKYARGYRGGGVNQTAVNNETWDPEKLDTYEAGLKSSFSGALRGSLNISAFYNDFRNQQVSLSIPNCTGRPTCAAVPVAGIQNIGHSRIRGFELDAMVEPANGLRIEIGYAYLDAKVKSTEAAPCDNTAYNCIDGVFLKAGDTLPFAPKNRVTLTGTYRLPLNEGFGRISLGATFTHTDRQFVSHTVDHAFAAGIVPINTSVVPATDLLALNLNWNDVGGAPIDLALFATNVTNRKYTVAATNNLNNIGADFVLLGEPRMFGLRAKYRFGE
ncbi:TonB-dependent receptor [Novosphingobium sp. CF614]|uniref:TonB-dependent receptor domain-containing protein n=1 Tax=Novosphingobium sp. CF614 TaxID=1884364 RepID=UPI0015A71D68|nr:TonB-dependent receptor [Novosphingobium sp. CF614]